MGPLITLFISVVQKLDENCLAPLIAHQDKTIGIEIEHFIPIYLQVTESGLISIDKPAHIDTIFSGNLNAFMKTLFSKQKTQTGMHIKGDMDCAKAFYDCVQQIDIDWESHLAKGVGDNMAHLIVNSIKESKNWAHETLEARTGDLGHYLQDEKELLPTRQECEAFYKEVDILRHDVERAQAILNHLQQRNESK